MLSALKKIIEIQELDMKMIRLMRLKKERQRELKKLARIRGELSAQVSVKEGQIIELKKDIKMIELEVAEVKGKIEKLEAQQNLIKKVEEFNALTHEVSTLEKQRHAKEQALSDLFDKLAIEDDLIKELQSSLDETDTNSRQLEEEIYESIRQINGEGQEIMKERVVLVDDADPETFGIYERLMRNKKNRVIVPIENRCCSGCNITLTAQDENVVRKGERLIFCEHCSRIHYWPEAAMVDGEEAPKRRRRPSKSKVS